MRLVGVDEDRLPALVRAARAGGRMPDVMTLPLAAAQSYAKDGVTDPEAAARVVGRLARTRSPSVRWRCSGTVSGPSRCRATAGGS